MSNMNFNTSNDTFRKLLGNGITYTVPRFQRDYSWGENEWDDLWQDILEIRNNEESAHYMGYLVLQSSDNKSFDIIDGQQRITTLSILVLAVLKNLQLLQNKGVDAEKNKKREEQLRNIYIGYLDPVTLISKSKLKLNNHNDLFYQNYLVPLQKMPQRGLRFSEKLIKKAFEWFAEKIKKELLNTKGDGTELAIFIDLIADKLFFTVITVNDELNAFKVFETLNARGVRLSATDLLKNYLFSVINNEKPHKSEIKVLEGRWENIVNKLGSESFPDFLRVYWNSLNKLVRKTDLFKVIKKSIQDKSKAFGLIRELDENADFYAALRYPKDEFWSNDQEKYINELGMFGIRSPYSFLMIAYKKLHEKDFNKILRACSIISFRYNIICGLHTGEQERVYNDIAFKIANNELNNAPDIIRLLKNIYPSDQNFKASFIDKEFDIASARNKRIVRYILFCLEKQLSEKDYDFESDKYSIEHILPDSKGVGWDDHDEEDYRYLNRLGNYTLLTKRENRDIGNKGFEEKKEVYKKSNFKITQQVAEDNAVWNVERIVAHQSKMAGWATSVWRLE